MYQQSVEYAEENLSVAERFDHKIGQFNAYAYMGLAYSALGEFDMAQASFQNGLRISQDLANSNLNVMGQMTLIGIADLWKRMGKTDETLLLLYVLEKHEFSGRPDFYQMHQALLTELTAILSQDQIDDAKSKSKQKSLNDYIATLFLE